MFVLWFVIFVYCLIFLPTNSNNQLNILKHKPAAKNTLYYTYIIIIIGIILVLNIINLELLSFILPVYVRIYTSQNHG